MTGVGISFGNTSAYVAVSRDGHADIIANSAGERVTSTTVAFQEGEVLTGSPALQFMVRQPTNSVSKLKSLIGKSLDEVTDSGNFCKLEPHNEEIIVNFSNTARKGVSSLVKCVFDNLKETADSSMGEGNHKIAISVPLNATPIFKTILSRCATSAGFSVVDMIPEPIAALLPLDLDPQNTPDGHTCVVRIGGSSMSITIIAVASGMYSVLGQVESNFGGNIFDKSISKFLCGEFNRKHRCKVEENQRSLNKALRESRSIKHNLSTLNTSECNIESLFDGMDLTTNLSRPRFETLIQNDLNKMKDTIKSFLLQKPDASINRVVLVGGSCKIPKVQTTIKEIFPSSTIVCLNADEIQAMGAALHSELVSKYPDVKNKTDVEANGTTGLLSCPSDVVIRVGDKCLPVVPKNAPLPCKVDVTLPEGNVISIETQGRCLAKAEIKSSEEKSKTSAHIVVSDDCSIEAVLKDENTNERTTILIPAPTA